MLFSLAYLQSRVTHNPSNRKQLFISFFQIDSSLIVNSALNGKLNLLEMRQLSASQLHLLLHPTDDQDDADLKESNDLVKIS